MAFTIVAFLLISTLPLQAVAFGPRLEPIAGGYGPRSNLFAVSDYDEPDEHENITVASSRVYTIPYETQFEELDGEVFQRRLFIAEPFIFHSSMFGVRNPFDTSEEVTNAVIMDNADYGSCIGDDCDECFIPEEYKHVESHVDVMAYLGIKRVEPIRALLLPGDWE
jgi:hypothetical protein